MCFSATKDFFNSLACLEVTGVWRILTVKSQLLVYSGQCLLPSYVSIKNVGVKLTGSYCAAGMCAEDGG